MKKIGMIAAMLEESQNVLVWLGECVQTDRFGEFIVHKYIKNDCEIYFINSGVGEILASCSTQLLISTYKVDMIINFGLAGSLGEAKLSQMCVIGSIVHYDFDISALENIEVGRYSRFDSPLVKTNEELVELALSVKPEIKKVVCASADKFVSDNEIKDKLSKNYGAQICEMESAGIHFTCIANKVPALFIKVISDTKDNAEEFTDFLERNNFEFVSVLDELTKKIK